MVQFPHQPRSSFQEDPYTYPPRPFPPSLPPTFKPSNGAPYPPFNGGGMKRPRPPAVSGIMAGFTNEEGRLDVQKTMTTIDTAVKTYQQVSPMIKQLSSMFIPRG